MPSGATLVAKSNISGSPDSVGTAMLIGFVDRRPARPPNGATHWPWPPVFDMTKPAMPDLAACSA